MTPSEKLDLFINKLLQRDEGTLRLLDEHFTPPFTPDEKDFLLSEQKSLWLLDPMITKSTCYSYWIELQVDNVKIILNPSSHIKDLQKKTYALKPEKKGMFGGSQQCLELSMSSLLPCNVDNILHALELIGV